MQKYIRAVYEVTPERGHLCPCSTVRDIRKYVNELIRKRFPGLSNKKIMEATQNVITNAGGDFVEKQTDESWKAGSVQTEKQRIKKFIRETLEELVKPPGSYAAFKAGMAGNSSTPKKVSPPKMRPTPKTTPSHLSQPKPVNRRMELLKQLCNNTNSSKNFTTPDRKIVPKVASESKFFMGMIDYENGKPVVSSPTTDIRKDSPDPADSPLNRGFNSFDLESTISESDLIEKETEEDVQLYDSLEDLSKTPKRDVDLPRMIKRLEDHFSDLNASLRESSEKHSQRKRVDSLSSVHQLIDKMVPETMSPNFKKNNSSGMMNITETPIKFQTQMFHGNCRNLLEKFKEGTIIIKKQLEERQIKLNNSLNKQLIDSMLQQTPRKRCDSLNFDTSVWKSNSTEIYERKRNNSLNLGMKTDSMISPERSVDVEVKICKPDGIINQSTNESKKDEPKLSKNNTNELKKMEFQRLQAINAKLDDLSARIQRVKMNIFKVG